MILTREQELFLISLGVQHLTEIAQQYTKKPGPNKGKTPWNKGKKIGPRKKHNGHKWTDAQHKKFVKTMRKKWREQKREQRIATAQSK